MTEWLPEVGEKTVPEVVKEKVVQGVLNPLPDNTRVRAIRGKTVIEGKVKNAVGLSTYPLITIVIDEVPDVWDGYQTDIQCWMNTGWTFEVID